MSNHIKIGPALKQPRIMVLPGYGDCASVLRLDEIHPVVSGNKWYKLRGYIECAVRNGQSSVVTFGGAYSNHIVATAAACSAYRLTAHGIIRGEQSARPSPTLMDALKYGMQLEFISRTDYREKKIPDHLQASLAGQKHLLVPEGGCGAEGIVGVSDLYRSLALHEYSHLICAVGTGTTLAGLVVAAPRAQNILGISALKNNRSLEATVAALAPSAPQKQLSILHQFHFGGYAKHPPELLHFMNELYRNTGVPTDIVYTGKMFFAFHTLWQQGLFKAGSRILLVHSGGLQGNRSLPEGKLVF